MEASLDHQLGDMVWSIITGLRSGYTLRQSFEALSNGAPEPTSIAARLFVDELERGGSGKTALAHVHQAFPSPDLDRVVDIILDLDKVSQAPPSIEQQWMLVDALELLGDELVRQGGSDPAFYPFMREEAKQLGARVPERARPR